MIKLKNNLILKIKDIIHFKIISVLYDGKNTFGW